MAATGVPEFIKRMDSNSISVEVDSHVRTATFRLSKYETNDSTLLTAVSKGQAIGMRILDTTDDLSGDVYPTNYEDLNFVGFAAHDVALLGTATSLKGESLTVIYGHGIVANVQADGALTIGDRVMTSGKIVKTGSNDTVMGSVKKMPPILNETHTATATEASSPRFIMPALKPAGIPAVYNLTKALAYVFYPYSFTLAATKQVKMDTDGQKIILYDNASEIATSDSIYLSYTLDPRYNIGRCLKTAADNGLTVIELGGVN